MLAFDLTMALCINYDIYAPPGNKQHEQPTTIQTATNTTKVKALLMI